jgi:2,3-bisphosphoglycerate-independent phosphoglycerate mutase
VAEVSSPTTSCSAHQGPDSRGEDSSFEAKQVIEQVDAALLALLNLNPDVVVVTGDHSTPARMKQHSFHPVPTLIWAPETHRPDDAICFGERECQKGGLGQFPAADLMPLALGHAKRLSRYGA